MRFDIWYEGETVAFADCSFYDLDVEYRGNLYNKNGKIIGDYSTKNSVEIERRFPYFFKDDGSEKKNV